jgi:transposase
METKTLKQVIGVDVAKDSLSWCLGSLRLDLDKKFEIYPDVSNNPKGFQKILTLIKKQKNEKLVVVMEATGVYHEALAFFLNENGVSVSIMQSGRVKRYAQSLDQRSKTDALDSRMLAMLGCERNLPLWSPPGKTLRELKALSRERGSLVKEKQVLRNRLHATETAAFTNKREIRRYGQRLKLIEKQLKEIEAEMKVLVKQDGELTQKLQCLESIPGISFISAATVIGETLGFDGITSAKQLTSYAGYDVILKESGSFRGKTRISKKGNKRIRGILHMPSMTAVRSNPTLKIFYERLKPNKIKPMIALVAVQRKLLILMYTLWKNESIYDPKYEQKKQQDQKDLAALDRFSEALNLP